MGTNNLITKAFTTISRSLKVQKASKGTLSDYVVNSPHQYGQPNLVVGDDLGLITPFRMREIARRTPTVAACVNAILDYCTNVNILIRNVNAALPADPGSLSILQSYLDRPNGYDTKRHFLGNIIRDLTILGYAAVEIEPNNAGNPANLYVLDAARITIDYDEHGTVLGYDMLDILGMPIKGKDGVHAWTPDQIIFFRRDTRSESLYPESRFMQLFSCALLEDMMLAFIGGKFTESNIPYGIYNMGDVTDMELKQAISSWNSQAKSNHKIIITGGRGATNWTEFGYALKDLEAVSLLAEIRGHIMSILGVTMNELGESQDVNKSNGYNLSYTFKRRAIEPVMSEITTTLNKRFVCETLNFHDLETYFDEIDSRDELLQAQIDKIYQDSGVYSANHIANRKGLTSVPGGDDRYIIIGQSAVPLDLLRPLAQAQLDAIRAEVQAVLMGAQAAIQGPQVKPPASPISTTNVDGASSSKVKISYPKPQAPQPAGTSRGPVQANQAAGLRKDSP